MFSPEALESIRRYHNGSLDDVKRYLGGGTDGDVWESSTRTAIKVLKSERGYWNEHDSYRRLQDYGITEKLGEFWVPRLIDCNDELRIIEIEMMHQSPYVIDFAKVRIDPPPDFSPEIEEYTENEGQKNFRHNWPRVKCLLDDLASFGLYYLDAKPGNITFPDML